MKLLSEPITVRAVHFIIPKERVDEIVPQLLLAIGPAWKLLYFQAYFFGKRPWKKKGLNGRRFRYDQKTYNDAARRRVLKAFKCNGGNGLVGQAGWFSRKRAIGKKTTLYVEMIEIRFDLHPYDIWFSWKVELGDCTKFESLITLCEKLECQREDDHEW